MEDFKKFTMVTESISVASANTSLLIYTGHTPESIFEKYAKERHYLVNGQVIIDREDTLKAMQEYAELYSKEAHNKAVQSCIDAINYCSGDTHLITDQLEKLKKSDRFYDLEKEHRNGC